MNKILFILLSFLLVSCVNVKIQNTKIDKEIVKRNHQTFSYQEGDSTYMM
ncbi:hypothetical protein [Flavobacterium sp. UBA6135]|nr:hypothetical protein [Flavobacterium sp. UBA6135]